MYAHINLTYLDELIKSFKKMTYFDGVLKIVEPVIPAQDICTRMNTFRLFELYRVIEDAIRSLYDDSYLITNL